MDATEIRMMWLYGKHLWPNWRLPETSDEDTLTREAWSRNLGGLDLSTVQAAMDLLSGERFPPPVGVIRSTAFDVLRDQGDARLPPDLDRAQIEVNEAVQRGYRFVPEWSHPAIAEAVKAVGWGTLCRAPDITGLQAHFRDFYALARARYERQTALALSTGSGVWALGAGNGKH